MYRYQFKLKTGDGCSSLREVIAEDAIQAWAQIAIQASRTVTATRSIELYGTPIPVEVNIKKK